MPALQQQTSLITLNQYEALPNDTRIEVFDGTAYDMSGPSRLHQALLRELILVFGSYIKQKAENCSVSPGNPEDAYIRKLYYYRNYGVREYWIVDPRRKIVTVNYFEGNIVSVQYPFDSVIKVNIYKDLYIDFSELSRILGI